LNCIFARDQKSHLAKGDYMERRRKTTNDLSHDVIMTDSSWEIPQEDSECCSFECTMRIGKCNSKKTGFREKAGEEPKRVTMTSNSKVLGQRQPAVKASHQWLVKGGGSRAVGAAGTVGDSGSLESAEARKIAKGNKEYGVQVDSTNTADDSRYIPAELKEVGLWKRGYIAFRSLGALGMELLSGPRWKSNFIWMLLNCYVSRANNRTVGIVGVGLMLVFPEWALIWNLCSILSEKNVA